MLICRLIGGSHPAAADARRSANRSAARSVRSRPWLGILLFAGFAILFLSLRSTHFMAVDGAIRPLEVYRDPHHLVHGNNHLLYPFWIASWARANDFAGNHAANWIAFLKTSQAMNALLASASIAILYVILGTLVDWWGALLATLMFGLSSAVVMHGTNSAEPVAGLFFTLASLALVLFGLRIFRPSLLFPGGVAMALALASYQSMGVAAGLAAFLCVWRSQSEPEGRRIAFAIKALVWILTGGLFAVVVIYGAAYSYEGIEIRRMPSRFFSLGGASRVYSGFRPSNMANIPLGLIRNLYGGLPDGYAGMRSLLHHSQRSLWLFSIAAGIVILGATLSFAFRAISASLPSRKSVVVLTAIVAAALLLFPQAYWEATYDKLWLLPLAAFSAIVAIGFRPGALTLPQRTGFIGCVSLIIAAELCVNVPRAVESHLTPTPHLRDAEDFAAFVQPRDKVVLDFDEVSLLWLAALHRDNPFLLLPASTPEAARAWIQSAKQTTASEGGRLLFLGVLDHDRSSWDRFLGNRVRIPFDLLEEFRQASAVRKSYVSDSGRTTVRVYPR